MKGKLEKDLNTEQEQVDFLKNPLNKVLEEKEEVHNNNIDFIRILLNLTYFFLI